MLYLVFSLYFRSEEIPAQTHITLQCILFVTYMEKSWNYIEYNIILVFVFYLSVKLSSLLELYHNVIYTDPFICPRYKLEALCSWPRI